MWSTSCQNLAGATSARDDCEAHLGPEPWPGAGRAQALQADLACHSGQVKWSRGRESGAWMAITVRLRSFKLLVRRRHVR